MDAAAEVYRVALLGWRAHALGQGLLDVADTLNPHEADNNNHRQNQAKPEAQSLGGCQMCHETCSFGSVRRFACDAVTGPLDRHGPQRTYRPYCRF